MGDPAQDPSSYDHLLDALARMPNLVTLSLWCCLPSRPQGHPARKDTAALSFLQELAIDGAPVECIDIVKYLRVPASCMLSLTCDEDWAPGTPVPIGDLAPFFAASFQRTGKPLLQDLLLLFDEMCKSAIFQLGWTPYAPDIGHRSVDSRINIDSHMFIELPIPPSLEPMETMCAMLPLDALRTLSVSTEDAHWSAASWLAAFGRCSALEYVYLEGDSNVVQFFKALLRPADGGPAPPNGAFLGPDQWFLRSLRSVTMSDIHSSHMVDGPDTQDIMLIDYLKACLQRRAAYVQKAIDVGIVEGVDGRLPKLCINASSILKDHVFGLAYFVQEIDWDEAENQIS